MTDLPPPDADEGAARSGSRPAGWWILGGGIGVVVGSLLPWSSRGVGVFTRYQAGVEGDGVFTFLAGVLLAGLGVAAVYDRGLSELGRLGVVLAVGAVVPVIVMNVMGVPVAGSGPSREAGVWVAGVSGLASGFGWWRMQK